MRPPVLLSRSARSGLEMQMAAAVRPILTSFAWRVASCATCTRSRTCCSRASAAVAAQAPAAREVELEDRAEPEVAPALPPLRLVERHRTIKSSFRDPGNAAAQSLPFPRVAIRESTGITPMRASLSRMLLNVLRHSPSGAKWQYSRTGNPSNSAITPIGGYTLMGGSPPGNEVTSLAYIAERANGGDLLILRAGARDHPKHIAEIKAHYRLNSVATLAFVDRTDSYDSEVVRIINEAGSIFLPGGNQSH